MKLRKTLVSVATSAALAFAASSTFAETVSFSSITNNDPVSSAIGEAQFSVDVVEVMGMAKFTFTNIGPEASSISNIYFDDGSPSATFASIHKVHNGPGVDFVVGGSPGDLPGGNSITPAFTTSFGLLASSIPPPSSNGVNPGEAVAIKFNYQTGQSFADVLDGLSSGDLRIGLHAIAFANGSSESFVNGVSTVVSPIPEPETYAMMLAGLGFLGFMARRKGNKLA